MPDKDILSAVGEQSERVLHKATESIEICQRFMALVSLCALESNRRGNSVGGVRIGNVSMSGDRMIAKVTFSKIIIPRVPEAAPNSSTLVEFLHREARGLWLFIQKNPDLVRFLEQVIEKVDSYCRYKGKKFEEVTFSNAFMDSEDNIVLEIEKGA